jgi:hypothetical protein
LLEKDARPNRPCSVVLIDEVDSMLVDQSIQCTYLSHDYASTGLKHIQPILAMIWMHVSQYSTILNWNTNVTQPLYCGPLEAFHKTLSQISEHAVAPPNVLDIAGCENILLYMEQLTTLSDSHVVSVIRDLTQTSSSLARMDLEIFRYHEEKPERLEGSLSDHTRLVRIFVSKNGMTAHVRSEEELLETIINVIKRRIPEPRQDCQSDQLDVPEFLRTFVFSCLRKWVKSALKASQMIENREYTVHDSRRIYPIDHSSTGVTEVNKKWGDGLQQFLELKHELPMSPLPFMTNFMSNMAYINSYKRILGVSGTLGTEVDQQFYGKKVRAIKIPSYWPKKCLIIDEVLAENESEWIKCIFDQIYYWYYSSEWKRWSSPYFVRRYYYCREATHFFTKTRWRVRFS